MSRFASERGAALIIVLGVVAIVAAWASTAAYEDMVSLRRAENIQDSSRAWLASESAVELVRLYLREDARDNQVDSLDELWAMPQPPLPVDDGMVAGEIADASRYFNLNDMVDKEGKVKADAVQIVRNLFRLLQLDPLLVDRLVDWMDADDNPSGNGGAEDFHYYDKLYRVKNGHLDRWQELALIDGFDAEVLDTLRPFVTVRTVPEGGKTAVNINTAEAEVLRAIFPNMADTDAESVISGRPYNSVSDAITGQAWASGGDSSRLSVASDAFIVRTDALFGRARWREEWLLTRTADGKTAVEYREQQAWTR